MSLTRAERLFVLRVILVGGGFAFLATWELTGARMAQALAMVLVNPFGVVAPWLLFWLAFLPLCRWRATLRITSEQV